MANGGWYGTQELWERLQAPLLTIDAMLDHFAEAHGLLLSKNAKDCPERSLRWGDNPGCLIQIYPESEDGPTWNLWLCCSEDRGGSRYWRRDFAIQSELTEWRADLKDLAEIDHPLCFFEADRDVERMTLAVVKKGIRSHFFAPSRTSPALDC